MGSVPAGRAGHPFRTEIGRIGQHGGDIPRCVARADICEVIGKARPVMHVSQEIKNFDQRIHLADLGTASGLAEKRRK